MYFLGFDVAGCEEVTGPDVTGAAVAGVAVTGAAVIGSEVAGATLEGELVTGDTFTGFDVAQDRKPGVVTSVAFCTIWTIFSL